MPTARHRTSRWTRAHLPSQATAAVALVLALAGLASLSACAREERVVIGALLPLSGDLAEFGEQARLGLELAVEETNASGGVQGLPLHVVYQDCAPSADDAFTALLFQHEVAAVIAGVGSETVFSIRRAAQERHVVVLAPTASAPGIESSPYVYRLWPSDDLAPAFLARWAASAGYMRIAVLHSEAFEQQASMFAAHIQEQGAVIASVEECEERPSGDRSRLTLALSRLQAERPDMAFLVGVLDPAPILREAAAMGLGCRFVGTIPPDPAALATQAGDAAEGFSFLDVGTPNTSPPSLEQQRLTELSRTKFGEPTWLSWHAFDALRLLVEVLRRGARSGDEIRRGLDDAPPFKGITGQIVFDENGAVTETRFTVRTISGGEVADWSPETTADR